MFKQLQQVGKAFMLPIAILPAAGLLLGIGGALSNKATVQAYPLLDHSVLQGVFQIMSAAGSVVFGNLALLLCIGLGIGLAKRDKGVAALAATVGGWATVYLHCPESDGNIVIQEGTTRYLRPARGDLTIITRSPPAEEWQKLKTMFERHKKGKIALQTEIYSENELAAVFDGRFVVLG